MNDAAGAAQGVKREVDTVVRNQAEKILNDLDIVKREEFEAVKDMARLAREENEALKARIAALEAKLGDCSGGGARSGSVKTEVRAETCSRSSGHPDLYARKKRRRNAGVTARSSRIGASLGHAGLRRLPAKVKKSLHFLVISPLWG